MADMTINRPYGYNASFVYDLAMKHCYRQRKSDKSRYVKKKSDLPIVSISKTVTRPVTKVIDLHDKLNQFSFV